MSTTKRREIIKRLIRENEISTQEELALALNKEGFSVTQATVSRDIKELGLIKVKAESGTSKYSEPLVRNIHDVSGDRVVTLLKTFLVSIERARNLVVIKTLTGNGSSCGMAIDKLAINGVVGSIAGDDTLLIVTHDDDDAENVVKFIKEVVKQ